MNPFSRREFLAFLGITAMAPAAIEIAKFLPDSTEPLTLPHAPHVQVHLQLGDHVIYPENIPNSPRHILSGEIKRNFITEARQYLQKLQVSGMAPSGNLATKADSNHSLADIWQAFTGKGSGKVKNSNSILAMVQALHRGQVVVAADTEFRIENNNLDKSLSWNQTIINLMALAAAEAGAVTVARQLHQPPTTESTPPPRYSRRRFIGGLATLLAGNTVAATAMGTAVLDAKIPSSRSNLPFAQTALAMEQLANQATSIVSGPEAAIFAELFVVGRSLNMVRNTTIAAALVDHNRQQVFPGSGDAPIPLSFPAGVLGHSDIRLYLAETTEEQDKRISNIAQKTIAHYLHLLQTPLAQRHNQELDPEIYQRFRCLASTAFGVPTLGGIDMPTVVDWQIPPHLPRSTALIFIEELSQACTANRHAEPNYAHYLLQEFINTYEEIYLSGSSKYNYLEINNDFYTNFYSYPHSLQSLGCLPETTKPDDVIDNMQIFPHLLGQSAPRLFATYGAHSDVAMLPYGYTVTAGIPRIIYAAVYLTPTGSLDSCLYYDWQTGSKTKTIYTRHRAPVVLSYTAD